MFRSLSAAPVLRLNLGSLGETKSEGGGTEGGNDGQNVREEWGPIPTYT